MIALISDIHGNYVALEQVLKSIDSMGITTVYCLGDVAGYYSQINECCDALRARDIISIMGNHDWYLGGGGYCLRSQSVNDCLSYQRKVITSENLQWIASFPVFKRAEGISMVHGGWGDPIDEYLEISQEYFNRLDGKVFASGHTHVQMLVEYPGKTYCNPGSVGQPRDGDPRAAFATWNGQKFQLHRVEYDVEKVGELMEKAGFSEYYYRRLRTGASKM